MTFQPVPPVERCWHFEGVKQCRQRSEFIVSAPHGMKGHVIRCEDHVVDAIEDPTSQLVTRIRHGRE
jgi:hypothetical protein